MRTRSSILLAAAGAAVASLGLAATAAAAQDATATVTVVHGIPESPFDVYVDDELVLDDFEPGSVTDPLELPAGDHIVDVVSPDADDNSAPLLSVVATTAAGENVTMVGHLTTTGDPTIDVFTNDTSALDSGQARLTVRHVAAAPAVRVTADEEAVGDDLANGQETVATLPAGDHDLQVRVVAGGELLAESATTLAAGTNTIVYGIGSTEGGTLDLLVQEVTGLGEEPRGVPAGTGGLVGDGSTLPAVALGLLGIGALAFALRGRVRPDA